MQIVFHIKGDGSGRGTTADHAECERERSPPREVGLRMKLDWPGEIIYRGGSFLFTDKSFQPTT